MTQASSFAIFQSLILTASSLIQILFLFFLLLLHPPLWPGQFFYVGLTHLSSLSPKSSRTRICLLLLLLLLCKEMTGIFSCSFFMDMIWGFIFLVFLLSCVLLGKKGFDYIRWIADYTKLMHAFFLMEKREENFCICFSLKAHRLHDTICVFFPLSAIMEMQQKVPFDCAINLPFSWDIQKFHLLFLFLGSSWYREKVRV